MRKLTQASFQLNFHPVASWPSSLPVITWSGLVVAGFDRFTQEEPPLFEVTGGDFKASSPSLAQTLHECHPDLGLAELGRLYTCLRESTLFEETWPVLCRLKKMRDSESHRTILEKLLQTPVAFQSWINEKRVGFRDLAILNSLSNVKDFTSIFSMVPGLQLSKSDGVRALELACELRLLGHSWSEILQSPNWLSHLETLRFPKTTEYDQTMSMTLRKLPWPRHLNSKWIRQGDQGAIEIRFQVDSIEAFEHTLHSLERVSERLKEDSPWSN